MDNTYHTNIIVKAENEKATKHVENLIIENGFKYSFVIAGDCFDEIVYIIETGSREFVTACFEGFERNEINLRGRGDAYKSKK